MMPVLVDALTIKYHRYSVFGNTVPGSLPGEHQVMSIQSYQGRYCGMCHS
jgi:hypothetical protein